MSGHKKKDTHLSDRSREAKARAVQYNATRSTANTIDIDSLSDEQKHKLNTKLRRTAKRAQNAQDRFERLSSKKISRLFKSVTKKSEGHRHSAATSPTSARMRSRSARPLEWGNKNNNKYNFKPTPKKHIFRKLNPKGPAGSQQRARALLYEKTRRRRASENSRGIPTERASRLQQKAKDRVLRVSSSFGRKKN
jgi:hypothetical protein